MAKIVITSRYVIISNRDIIIAYDINDPDIVHVLTTSGDCQRPEASSHSPPREAVKTTKEPQTSAEGRDVLCMVACKCGNHLAATTDEKQLVAWTMGNSFTRTCIRKLPRKCLSMAFLKDCSHILIADKTGDVIKYDVQNNSGDGIPILGHLSMILDIILSFDDEYVLTCDRDEKIRVSCYPNCYNIHAFCLGHTEFVIKLDFLHTNGDILVSGSGDGTLKFWRFKTGEEIGNVQCRDHIPEECLKMLLTDQDKCSGQHHSALTTAKESNEQKLAVKKFVCSANNAIAITYHKLPLIGIYQVDVSLPDYKVTCTHTNTHLLGCEPLDLTFDSNNRLWVLTPSTDHPVKVFSIGSTTENGPLTGSSPPPVHHLIERLNANTEFFKGIDGTTPSIIPSLYKQWYDNVTRYLDIKKEREQQQQQQKHFKKFKSQVSEVTKGQRTT